MDSSIKDILKSSMNKSGTGDQLIGQTNVQSEELFNNIVQIEVDKLKKDAKEKMREYEEKLLKKNKIINDLLTDQENIKTEKHNLELSMKSQMTSEQKIKFELDQAIKNMNKKKTEHDDAQSQLSSIK